VTDVDNVMPIRLRPLGPRRDKKKADPTNAERSRRWRQRRKEMESAVAEAVAQRPIETLSQEALPTVAEPIEATATQSGFPNNFNAHVTHIPSNRTCFVTFSTTASALALATVSAGFSITGMTAIFVGSFWPVIAMGVALEAGKLSVVAWLGRYRTAPWRLRTALVALVAVLMALNAIGAYGSSLRPTSATPLTVTLQWQA
jgi:hypothetical protein